MTSWNAAGGVSQESSSSQTSWRGGSGKGAGGGWLAFTTDDVEAAFTRVKESGADITQDVVTQPYGRDFALRDPSGNPIRIGEVY